MASMSILRVAKIAGVIAGVITGIITASAGAIVGIGTIWTTLDLPVLAWRSYVDAKDVATRAYIDGKDTRITIAVIAHEHDLHGRLKRTRDAYIARLAITTDQQLRIDIQLLLDQSSQDVLDVETRIAGLERLRGGP